MIFPPNDLSSEEAHFFSLLASWKPIAFPEWKFSILEQLFYTTSPIMKKHVLIFIQL